MNVHPIAALFPMMSDEELNDLADDIKTNGLRSPLVFQKDVLIDGRNRLEACKRAGVKPTTSELPPEEDPVAFILSTNVQRRMLSKGQQAMAYAMAYPEGDTAGRKKGDKRIERNPLNFSGKRLVEARLILRESPELAKQVMGATKKFDKAYEEAIEVKRLREECEKQSKEVQALIDQMIAEKSQSIQTDLDSDWVKEDIDKGLPPMTGRWSIDQLKREQRVLTFLVRIKRELRDEAEQEAIEFYDNSTYLKAVRSGVKQIIDAATLIADNYNKAAETRPTIKRIK